MKKRYILLLLPLILILSGCGSNNVNSTDNNTLNKIELYDEEKGFKTTFSYDENVHYSDVEKDDEDDMVAYEFDNDDLDVELQMFYLSIDYDTYNNLLASHTKDINFKKYVFNNFDGYTFGNLNEELELYIILNDNKKDHMYNLLYTIISRMDQDEKIIVRDVFNGKELQALFDSTTFEIVNNN